MRRSADRVGVSFVRPLSLVLVAALAVSCSRLETAEQRAERAREEAPERLAFDALTADQGPTLRLALVRPETWDPIELSMSDQDGVIIADLLFDGLTEATADGRLIPALASGWSSTDDYQAWTFALDTERISAEQVRKSFERLQNGAPESAASVLLSSVARIDVVDSATVRFVLSTPNAGFAWIVSGLPFSITDGDGSVSGRYGLVSDDMNRTVLLDEQQDEPVSVIIDWVVDHEAAEAASASGVVDGAVVPLAATVAAAQGVGAPVQARSIVRFYVLDPSTPALADLRVRRAVMASIDRAALVEDLPAPALVADSLVAPTTAGFAGGVCGVGCDFDAERAVLLLSEVGDRSAIRIGFSNDREEAFANAIVTQLGVVGLLAEPIEIVSGQLSEALANGWVDMVPFGWVAPAASVDAVLPALLSATSPANLIGSLGAEIDQALLAAAVTGDDTDRWALLQRGQQLALEQAVFVPVAVAENRFVASPAFNDVLPRADGSIEIRSLP